MVSLFRVGFLKKKMQNRIDTIELLQDRHYNDLPYDGVWTTKKFDTDHHANDI